jgi:hypothetical protein
MFCGLADSDLGAAKTNVMAPSIQKAPTITDPGSGLEQGQFGANPHFGQTRCGAGWVCSWPDNSPANWAITGLFWKSEIRMDVAAGPFNL